MALTVSKESYTKVVGGQAGAYLVRGVLAWTSTNATGDLPCKFRKILGGVAFTPLLAPASDEIHYVDTSVSGTLADGVINVPATGLLPIGRTGASKTSALPVSYCYVAY